MADKDPGWDAKTIAKVARESYGGFEAMFKHFGWSERGSHMMISAPKNIKREWGTVEGFVRHHSETSHDSRPLR